MRQLPKKQSAKQQLIIRATEDFCGNDGSTNKNKVQAALWIMGRKARVELTEEEKTIVWYVQNNIGDSVYCQSFMESENV